MRLKITISGDQARRFQEIREEIEKETGHDVTRPRVISELMQDWDGRGSR
jgi:hypothetical protein